jgi:hypothetical protein
MQNNECGKNESRENDQADQANLLKTASRRKVERRDGNQQDERQTPSPHRWLTTRFVACDARSLQPIGSFRGNRGKA